MPEVVRVVFAGRSPADCLMASVDEISAECSFLTEALDALQALVDAGGRADPVVMDTLTIFRAYASKVRQALRELELAGEIVMEAHRIH